MNGPRDDQPEQQQPPRYCLRCGEIFFAGWVCPVCGLPWTDAQLQPSVAGLVALLTEFTRMRLAGTLDERGYRDVRAHFEGWLLQLRPPRAAQTTPAAQRARPAPEPRAPSEPLLPKVAAWTAARQADILLYLGAFLLSIAALIFVGYQGQTLSGPLRFGVLASYTAGFLIVGLLLPRWERVREAGAVFLALGAVLTPIDAIALHTQVLGGSVPASWMWLIGACVTAALYLTLDRRGYGRLYRYPGLVAALIGWGALGAVLRLPPDWFGAWYVLLAVLLDRAVMRFAAPLRARVAIAVELLGLIALLVAQGIAFGQTAGQAQLPLAYALLSAAAVLRVLERRASARVLGALPPLAALTLFSTCWAAFGLDGSFLGGATALAALGYLALARLDLDERRDRWQATAAVLAYLALAAAHLGVIGADGADRSALPATYGLLLAGLLYLCVFERRRVALLFVPPIAAALAITAGWASGVMGLGWSAGWFAAAAFGYLACGEIDRPLRSYWRGAALLMGIVAALMAQVAAGAAPRAALPLAYAILLAGASVDAWLRRDRAIGLLPALVAQFSVMLCWAVWGNVALDWYGVWIAAAGLGYLALAETRRDEREGWRGLALLTGLLALFVAQTIASRGAATRWQLPLAYALVLAGVAWDALRRRDAALLLLPLLAAALADALLWSAGAGQQWWAFAPLAAWLLFAVAEQGWRGRPFVGRLGWFAIAAAALLIPLLFAAAFTTQPGNGAAVFALAAALALVVAVRGAPSLAVEADAVWPDIALATLRSALLLLGWAWLLVALGYGNEAAGLVARDAALPFAASGVAAWLLLIVLGRRWPVLLGSCAAAGVAGFAIAASLAAPDHGRVALLLTLGALLPAVAALTTRRAALLLPSAAFAGLALAALWRLTGLQRADLPIAYTLIGLLPWAGVARRRSYASAMDGLTLAALSWAGAALGLLVALDNLARRADRLAGGATLVRTREWAVLAIVIVLVGAQVTAEGARLRRRALWLPGTVAMLLALLAAIAIAQPGNVQAYALPGGLYLLAIGVSWAHPRDLVGTHLTDGEAITVAGLLVLVLPAAVQAWGPGGGLYGLELIGIGLLLLALGLPIGARWLVAGGVLTLSGVALRWLAVYSADVPRWLVLGAVGSALVAAGFLLLLHRERWDRARRAVARWWSAERRQPQDAASGR